MGKVAKGNNIPYQLVSMAAILRDYGDPEYISDIHEKLVDIADSIYNVGDDVIDRLKDEYKKLYDQCGADYFDKIIEDMESLDGQLTSDDKIDELIEDYNYRIGNVEASSKICSSSDVPASVRQSYLYQLLNRMRQDCDYALREYDRTAHESSREERKLYQRRLWANNAKDQIVKMKEIYNRLEEKPDWISMEDIKEYERRFKEILGKDYRGSHEYVGASDKV